MIAAIYAALSIVIVAVSLEGCAGAGDIKPGRVRGPDGEGYVKTTEGFGIVTSGCPDSQLWTVARDTARTLRPSDWQIGGPLEILSTDESAGVIRAEDFRPFLGTTSYVGIYIHRLSPEIRLVEVTAFWKTRMSATANPWEKHLLRAMSSRLSCVVPPEHALQPGGRP